MSAIGELRRRTHDTHETVDAAFAHYDLKDRDSYRAFLSAHAAALPVAERRAAQVFAVRPRAPLLADDLAALGAGMPAVADDAPVDEAAAWGALYTVEGSRLGGRLLADMVGEGLPRAYLAAIHLSGEWRAIREAIDAAAEGHDEAWRRRMLDGAQDTFELYRRAASGVAG